MNAFLHHFTFEFRTGIRNKQLLLMNYLFPLGFYLMMGFIMPAINPPFRENIIPAMVVFGILSATLLGIPDPLVNARDQGIFRSYKINGIPSLSILVIPALTTMLHLVIVAAIITATAPLLFDAPLPRELAQFCCDLFGDVSGLHRAQRFDWRGFPQFTHDGVMGPTYLCPLHAVGRTDASVQPAARNRRKVCPAFACNASDECA